MNILHHTLRLFFGIAILSIALSGCNWLSRSTPNWMGGESDKEIVPKTTNSSRVQIMRDTEELEIIPDAIQGITLSAPIQVDSWTQEGGGVMQISGHMKGSLLKNVIRQSEAGSGYDWNPLAIAPSPVVTSDTVYVMDGRGMISAHARNDIDTVLWKSKELYSKSSLLSGGLAFSDGTLYSVNGHGTLCALDGKTGAKRWRRDLQEPVRSSVRVRGDMVLVTTAESRLLAFETIKGTLRWQHRGVGESTNLFGGASPVIAGDDGVIVAYPSGEFFRLRFASGEVVWGDNLVRPRPTLAAGLFAGVDANPIIKGTTIYASASDDVMLADDVNTGLRIWELPIGTTHSPWIDASALFLVTQDGKLTAINAEKGQIGWMKPLSSESAKSTTTHYYGPFLLNDTLITLDSAGIIYQFSPLTGNVIRSESLVSSIISSPAFAGKSAYLLGRDATLYQVQ